jgi:hypothetical protein
VLVTDPVESMPPELLELELELLELELLRLTALEVEVEKGVELAREFAGWPVTSTKTVEGIVVDFSVMEDTEAVIGMIVMPPGSVAVAELVVFSNLPCSLGLN